MSKDKQALFGISSFDVYDCRCLHTPFVDCELSVIHRIPR